MSESIVQTPLELWQVFFQEHFTGEPVPLPYHVLSEDSFPNIHFELPLSQLHDIPSGPIAGHWKDEINIPSASPHEEALGHTECPVSLLSA